MAVVTGNTFGSSWADVAVIMPWVLYQTFGDTEILKIQYDSMKKWIGFMRAHAVDYIWNYKLQFGDWVAWMQRRAVILALHRMI